jgi:hypothetical protein
LADIAQLNGGFNRKGVSYYIADDTSLNDLLNNTSLHASLKNDGVTDIIICIIVSATVDNATVQYTIPKLKSVVEYLQGQGFNISFKFHPNNNEGYSVFTGSVVPTDPATWFAAYKAILLQALAVSQNIKIVSVVNESESITQTQNYKTYWQDIITSIKAQNQTIKTTASPSQGGGDLSEDKCVFWDLVDYLGVNYYPSTPYIQVPTIRECKRTMYQLVSGLPCFQLMVNQCLKYGKKIIITEIGVTPHEYQTSAPYNWTDLGAYNETVQANFYEAFLNVLTNMSVCEGLFIWNVRDGYTFVDLEAENIVKKYYLNGGTE